LEARESAAAARRGAIVAINAATTVTGK